VESLDVTDREAFRAATSPTAVADYVAWRADNPR
jgi:hypothetical protein